MELSNRLKMVASCAKKYDFLVDVGTDHAYIPIYLLKNGIIKKAVACDISKGSVEKAKKNISLYGYAEQIETRCGDGLTVIQEDEFPDEIIIAGMGGMLIIDILKKSKHIADSAKRLILQPQRDIDKVRRYIHSVNLKITYENMIFEAGKFYNVIVCEKGLEDNYTDKEYLFGKILINEKNPFLKKHIEHELNKMNNVLININQKDAQHIIKRKNEILNKRILYEEVFKCL